MPPMASDAERLQDYERSFRRAGLPLFSEDISPYEDLFNRAAPLLGLVLLGELLGAGNLDWSWWQNLLAVAGGLVLLALIYAVVGLGLFSILRWVLARILAQLRSAFTLLARAVPLLAIFVLLSFPTQELWEIFSNPTRGIYVVILGLLAVLAGVFLAVRLPREARELERDVGQDSAPLRRPQLFNVELVMFVSQAVQVLLVSLMIGLFLTVFGVLAVDDQIRADWLGTPGNELLHFELFGERLELTGQLLRVAVGLAAFSGFYFAIAMFTDSTYREEFLGELTSEMRRSFKDRGEYLRLRDARGRDSATR
jgi:hypothetical protein